MLRQFILMSRYPSDVIFAAALLPILALSEDGSVSGFAREVLKLVEAKVSRADCYTTAAYAFQREMRRSLAESGQRRYADQLTDLISRNGLPVLEPKILVNYGWPLEALESNLERKLSRPTRRDENLKPYYEALGDLLLDS
jgi:hypothetical protein